MMKVLQKSKFIKRIPINQTEDKKKEEEVNDEDED